MAQESQLAHRIVGNENIPYSSNQSPTLTTPCFVSGSKDLLTTISVFAARRPGFSMPVERIPTVFTNLQRLFSWDRNDGTFYVMACDVAAAGVKVYKMQVGVDNSFVLIYTDTGNSTPFDFVTSNNTLYFGNGHVMKKWTPADGVSNWGIAIGSVNAAVLKSCTTGADVAVTGGTAWANPGNITAADAAFATCTVGNTAGVSAVTVTSPGSGYTSASVGFSGGGGTGAAATATIASNGGVQGVDIFDGGTGYTKNDVVTLSGFGSGTAQLTISSVRSSNGQVTLLYVSTAGSGYVNGTQISPTGGSGSGLSITINSVTNGAIQSVTVTNPGSGYTSAPTVTITGNGSGATATSAITAGTPLTDYLVSGTFAFGLANTDLIKGIMLEVKGLQSAVNGTPLSAWLTFDGVTPVGTPKTFALPAANAFVTLGDSSDMWGLTTLNAAVANGANFGFIIQGNLPNPNSPVTFSVDFERATIYRSGGPVVAVSGSAGTFAAVLGGYIYVYTYGNIRTGHISSPTPPSATTGNFAAKLNVGVTVIASTDTQVNEIHVYRTTDGGAGDYFEIPTSPYTNVNATITDNALDANLNVQSIAPLPQFNDPPTPGRGPVYFSGRLWYFVDNNVWFSGLEEIPNGVPEESFPSGIAGNFWSFDEPVNGVGVAGIGDSEVLLIFCGGRVYCITGNTLDTFRRFKVSSRRGCRNLSTIAMMGGMCAWLDSASQIWVTNGSKLEEISIPIRPDLHGIVHSECSMSFHTVNDFNWLVFSTGQKLFVYDVDTENWMPPWSVATRLISSGETSPGNYQLMIAGVGGTKALQLSTTVHRDDTATYQPVIRTSLHGAVPDASPSQTGYPVHIEIDTNREAPFADVAIMTDDDPQNSGSSYQSVFSNSGTIPDVFNRSQGKNLFQNVYTSTEPACRWVSLQFTMKNQDDDCRVYGWFLSYKPLGGR